MFILFWIFQTFAFKKSELHCWFLNECSCWDSWWQRTNSIRGRLWPFCNQNRRSSRMNWWRCNSNPFSPTHQVFFKSAHSSPDQAQSSSTPESITATAATVMTACSTHSHDTAAASACTSSTAMNDESGSGGCGSCGGGRDDGGVTSSQCDARLVLQSYAPLAGLTDHNGNNIERALLLFACPGENNSTMFTTQICSH